jgi:hypothetical protein
VNLCVGNEIQTPGNSNIPKATQIGDGNYRQTILNGRRVGRLATRRESSITLPS